MAPFPEEVDVFSTPHSRMKQLVEVYSEKLSCTDFTDYGALESLLHSLHQTFCEFKSHEQIENKYIMKKLKTKLKALSIQDAAVCNCHSDNRLSDMLALVNDGYSCTKKSESERINYGLKLQHALKEFTETFLPHMKEEEEVFQPMLMKYFEYELKCLKETVIEEHVKWQQDAGVKEKYFDDLPEDDSKNASIKAEDDVIGGVEFSRLPHEVMFHIFSFLQPRDLLKCAQVCHSWNRAAYDPLLWKELYPIHWARGYWEPHLLNCFQLLEDRQKNMQSHTTSFNLDEDADVDESSDSESDSCLYPTYGTEEGSSDCEDTRQVVIRERNVLNSIIKYLLPKIGPGVQKIVLTSSTGLTSRMLRSFLLSCPNMVYLDASYTSISDSAFKGLKDAGCLGDVQHLDFSGCSGLTDLALYRIADCMTMSRVKAANPASRRFGSKFCITPSEECIQPSALDGIAQQFLCKNCPLLLELCSSAEGMGRSARVAAAEDESRDDDLRYPLNLESPSGLRFLSLSGCPDVTDDGLRYMARMELFQSLTFLDVSGCWNMTGPGLCDVINFAPNLDPCNLFYCDYIDDGPYPEESNGCQNLECAMRLCCCTTGYY